MKKLFFVYNPHAGKAKVKNALPRILDEFDKAGFEVTLRPTHAKGDATKWICKYADRYDRLAIGGGDGTMNEALHGLLQASAQGRKPAPLGYLPAGTTNDFASSLGIPSQLEGSAKIAATGEEFLCDAGAFNGDPFVYVSAFGAFTECSYATSQQLKNLLGHLAYVLEGAKSLPQIKGIPMQIDSDAGTENGEYLYGMVSNTTSVGGFTQFFASQKVELNDGLLEVLLIKAPKTLAEKTELISALVRMDMKSKFFRVFKTQKVILTSPKPVSWTTDGEFAGENTTVTVEAIANAYNLIVPKKA